MLMEIYESIAEDPMMVSLHQVEVLYAQARAAMVKATIRRNKAPGYARLPSQYHTMADFARISDGGQDASR